MARCQRALLAIGTVLLLLLVLLLIAVSAPATAVRSQHSPKTTKNPKANAAAGSHPNHGDRTNRRGTRSPSTAKRSHVPDVWGPAFNATFYREYARDMFQFAYDSYMTHAFPLDELDPLECRGRTYDRDTNNININDVLGNTSTTLIDALDTLAFMGNYSEFWLGVNHVISHVDFDQDTHVQVFEANIRVLGGLLSAHALATTPAFQLENPEYDGELLLLARDLANRLLPAFDRTATGLPLPRVNLRTGAPLQRSWRTDTTTASVGTLLLEFGSLSRLLHDPTFEGAARRALSALWDLRNASTCLLGNTVDVHTGRWDNALAGFGAGTDSLYEYLLKASVAFGDSSLQTMFNDLFSHTGRACRMSGMPLYGQVHSGTLMLGTPWIDSLQAFLPGLKVLQGDLQGAIADHAFYVALWRKYKALPERFNFVTKNPEIASYPLRPELMESTYFLYRATKDPYYQRIGAEILLDLDLVARTKCGYATLRSVHTRIKEGRMESFFLSETLKYLYLLFDDANPVHSRQVADHSVFTTEGHLILLSSAMRNVFPASKWWPAPDEDDLDANEFGELDCARRYAEESATIDVSEMDTYVRRSAELLHQEQERLERLVRGEEDVVVEAHAPLGGKGKSSPSDSNMSKEPTTNNRQSVAEQQRADSDSSNNSDDDALIPDDDHSSGEDDHHGMQGVDVATVSVSDLHHGLYWHYNQQVLSHFSFCPNLPLPFLVLPPVAPYHLVMPEIVGSFA